MRKHEMRLDRRSFVAASTCCALSATAIAAPKKHDDLVDEIGITTGSFGRHFAQQPGEGKLLMLELPKIMRDDLGMRVLDLMTANLPSLKPDYLDKLRAAAQAADVTITNLKMNQKELDIGSADADIRRHAIDIYKSTIDAAHRLGCRWVRPLPRTEHPSEKDYVASYRELIDYAGPKGITLLIENFGWIKDKPDAIPRMIKAIGDGVDASVDTGNWTDGARYEGLAKAYPLAVTCDFKAFELGADNSHKRYDLKRCFDIGWKAGFRGPWCFEHFHKELKPLMKEMVRLRDFLTHWKQELQRKDDTARSHE